MKKSASFVCLLFLFVLLAATPLAAHAAQEAVATVVALRGKVVAVNQAGSERQLALKSEVYQDDLLRTGKNGRLQLLFTDNSIISLGGASEMKVAEYRWDPAKKDGALKIRIKEGTFRVMGGALSKDAPQNVKTETPTATIGIRGSMYAGAATPTSLSVVFQGGKGIEVSNAFGTVAITRPGFGTHVALNAPPMPPVKFTEQDLTKVNSRLNSDTEENDAQTPPADEDRDQKEAPSEGQEETSQQNDDGDQQAAAAPPGEENSAEAGPETQPAQESALASAPAPAPEPAQAAAPALIAPPTVPVPPPLPPANQLPSAPTFSTPAGAPNDGIYIYKGGLGGVSGNSSAGTTETIIGDVYMAVNWHNNTIFGAVFDPVSSTSQSQQGSPVFFFGHVNGSKVSGIQFFGFGGGGLGDNISAIEGSGSGLFFGTAYDFFNLIANGSSYLVRTNPQTTLDSWTVQGAAQQVVGERQPTSPTEPVTWEGFVVGVSENMNDSSNNRRYFLNSDPSLFALAIDRNAGTISGAMATDVNTGSGYQISGIEVGNTYGSAYIADKYLGTLLGCPGGTCTGGTDLKAHGNYMVVEDPEKQWSSYFTWGYWEAAYVDPVDTTQRHIHVPYSMWLAGKPTIVQPSTSFSGTYTGEVRATKIDETGARQVDGSFTLPVNFSNNSIAVGSIVFKDGYTLNTAATGAGAFSFPVGNFTATLSGPDTAGTLNGAFYGPNAEAMGGNFFTTGASLKYIGIFGGNKQ